MRQVIAAHQVKNLAVILTIQSNNLAVADIMIDWWNEQAPHIWKYKNNNMDIWEQRRNIILNDPNITETKRLELLVGLQLLFEADQRNKDYTNSLSKEEKQKELDDLENIIIT